MICRILPCENAGPAAVAPVKLKDVLTGDAADQVRLGVALAAWPHDDGFQGYDRADNARPGKKQKTASKPAAPAGAATAAAGEAFMRTATDEQVQSEYGSCPLLCLLLSVS